MEKDLRISREDIRNIYYRSKYSLENFILRSYNELILPGLGIKNDQDKERIYQDIKQYYRLLKNKLNDFYQHLRDNLINPLIEELKDNELAEFLKGLKNTDKSRTDYLIEAQSYLLKYIPLAENQFSQISKKRIILDNIIITDINSFNENNNHNSTVLCKNNTIYLNTDPSIIKKVKEEKDELERIIAYCLFSSVFDKMFSSNNHKPTKKPLLDLHLVKEAFAAYCEENFIQTQKQKNRTRTPREPERYKQRFPDYSISSILNYIEIRYQVRNKGLKTLSEIIN